MRRSGIFAGLGLPVADGGDQLPDPDPLPPVERDAGVFEDEDLVPRIGDLIDDRKHEIEIGHSDDALQVVAYFVDISVRKGRIDVDVTRPNLIDAFVQGQVDSPPRTVKKAVPVEVHHRPEGFDRGFVHIEKADARNIRRINHRFDILHKITKNPASSDAPEQTF